MVWILLAAREISAEDIIKSNGVFTRMDIVFVPLLPIWYFYTS